MQKIYIVFGTVFLLGILVWVGSQNASSVPAPTESVLASKLTATETNFDFGTISMAKGNATHAFAVANTTSEPVIVKKVYTSCMCTAANLIVNGKKFGPFGMPGHGGGATAVNATISPGDSVTVEAVYDPNAHGPAGVGQIDRFIYLEDAAGGQLQLEVKANVTP